jgi:hypothetical protein
MAFSFHVTSDGSAFLSAALPVCTNFLIGFNGVFAGSLCLKQCDRATGSAVLTILGVAFEVAALGPGHGEFRYPRGATGTGIGGLLVAGFYLWRKRQANKKRSQI